MIKRIRNLPILTKLFIFIGSCIVWIQFMSKLSDAGVNGMEQALNLQSVWILSVFVIAIFAGILFTKNKSKASNNNTSDK